MQVYKTRGVCSQAIQFELDGDTIKHVNFIGGCSGNTQGVARLVEGMKVKDAIARPVSYTHLTLPTKLEV